MHESLTDPVTGPGFVLKNVYSEPSPWIMTLHRVAVLPMACDESDTVKVTGRTTLEPILLMELSKMRHFECVTISPETMKKLSNRPNWSSTDRLPRNLMDVIEKETGGEAVLFVELTQYRPYAPMVIGWNLKLVDLRTEKILWAVDETFDAGEKTVANSARRFQMDRQRPNPVLAESRQVLSSPRLFGQYTAHAIAETLPPK